MTQAGHRTASVSRVFSLGVGACWLLLCGLQFGWGARYAWAYNLWQYLPVALVAGLFALSLLLCFPFFRGWVRRGLQSVIAYVAPVPGAKWLGLVAVFALLWILRERQLYGDSHILLWETAKGSRFLFPDLGASFLIGQLLTLGGQFAGTQSGQLLPVQLAVCLCGALTVGFVYRSCSDLAPHWKGAATLLILSGGLVRVFAGHVEVYAFLLVVMAAYVWASLAYLGARTSLMGPSLLLGLGVWVHLGAVCLLPSLLILPWLRERDSGVGARVAQSAWAANVAVLPVALFLAGAAFLGAENEWTQLRGVLHELIGGDGGSPGVERWNRGWGGEGTVGTAYVMLSAGHLKYLINAAHLLSPIAAPILVGALFWRTRTLWASDRARFLATCCLPLGVYALVLRPVWGPFDWDLFSLSAFFFSFWAAEVYGNFTQASRAPDEWQDPLTWLIGSTAVFVTLPFLLIAPGASRDAGPFGGSSFTFELLDGEPEKDHPIAPWL